jgi:hypothetical protein
LLKQHAIVGSSLVSDKAILETLNLLETLISSQKNYLINTIHILYEYEVKYEGMAKIIALQQNELIQFLTAVLSKDSENEAIAGTLIKIEQFKVNIENLPGEIWTDEEVEELFSGALTMNDLAINAIKNIKGTLETKIKDQELLLKQNEEDEIKLREPPPAAKPAARTYPIHNPANEYQISPYPYEHFDELN